MSTNFTSIALAGISGYDFSSITKALINNYSLPLNQMNDTKSALETKKDAWRDVNTRMSALENALTKLRDNSIWNATKVSSSNTSLLTATSTAGAQTGTYNVVVKQLALAQSVASNAQTSVDQGLGLAGGTIYIKAGTDSSDPISVNIRTNASLNDIAEAINEAKAGVTASVVKTSDGYKLTMTSNESGADNAAVFTDGSQGILRELGILDAAGALRTEAITQTAKDAVISVNGLDVVSSSNTITDAIKGVTLDLTESDPNKTITLKVESDASAAQDAVQAFVDQYNSLMTFINSKTSFEWDASKNEAKTKGDLLGDVSLNAIRDRLRGMLSTDLGGTGTFSRLSQIGISTSSANYGKDGTLEFDTTKFAEAIAKDPESVRSLIGGAAGDTTKGLANVMGNYVHAQATTGGSISKTIASYDTRLSDINDRIEAFNKRIERYTESINAQFTRLETLLSQLDAQASAFDTQLAQLTNTK